MLYSSFVCGEFLDFLCSESKIWIPWKLASEDIITSYSLTTLTRAVWCIKPECSSPQASNKNLDPNLVDFQLPKKKHFAGPITEEQMSIYA